MIRIVQLIFIMLPFFAIGQTSTVNQGYRIIKSDTLNGVSIMQGSNNSISFNLASDPGNGPDTLRFSYDNTKVNLSADSLVFTTSNYTTTQSIDVSAPFRTDSVGLEYWKIDITKNRSYCGSVWVKTFDQVFDTAAIQQDLSLYYHFLDGDTSSLNALRLALIDSLYFTGTNPSGFPDTISTGLSINTDSSLFYPGLLTNIGQFNRYAVTTTRDTASWTNYYWHIRANMPRSTQRPLMLVSFGHRGFGVNGAETLASCYDINYYPELFKFFNDRGYDLLVSHMPISCKNIGDGKANSGTHNGLQLWEESDFNPLAIFTKGWYQALSYCLSNFTYDPARIYMTGISGGGWTATIVPAIDKRIKKSFAVAGTYPIYIRDIINSVDTNGDYEQGGVAGSEPFDLFRNSFSYLDLYLLAAQNGVHYQVFNESDNCCFDGLWQQSFRDEIKQKSSRLNGLFDVYQYDFPQHSYTDEILEFIYDKIR